MDFLSYSTQRPKVIVIWAALQPASFTGKARLVAVFQEINLWESTVSTKQQCAG